MSQRALMLAVRDYLRTNATLANAECDVMFDGQPPPACGERFVAVHPGQWAGGNIEGLEESFGVNITVTMRAGKTPQDRVGVNLLVGPTGKSLDELLEKIRALLHLDKGAYPVLALANTTLGGTVNGFVEPLKFRDGGLPQPKGPDWFSAEWNEYDHPVTLPPMGIAQTLTLGDAKRYQTVESQG